MTTQEQQHSPEQQKSVTSTVVVLPCRIFYSTQSGRAKAGARRTARILHDHGTRASTHPPPPPGQQQQQQDPPMIQLQNGHGTTFDEAFEEFMNRHHDEAVPTNFNSNTHTTSTSTSTTSPIEQFVHHMKQSGTAVLLCFISTTGDGEHTVRTLVYTVI